jgi:hypothetical protein
MGQSKSPKLLDRHQGPAAISAQNNDVTEPTFLGEDCVCTQLPTYITLALSKEQQGSVQQAYEGWEADV